MPLATVDLMSLPVYEHYRRQHQRRLIRHRRERTVPLGPHMRVHFEDETTLLYPIQEVRRAERNDDRSARPAPLDHRHPEPPIDRSQTSAASIVDESDALSPPPRGVH